MAAPATDICEPIDWAAVHADEWRAITVLGPWDLPIVAPHARPPMVPWGVPISDYPAALPEPKLCENRVWSTKWRGPLIIHSGRGWDRVGEQDSRVQEMWRALCPGLPLARAAWTWSGCVTAVAQLVDCHPARPDCCPRWGQRDPDVFHLVLTGVIALAEPIETRGYQKLWRPKAPLVERVRRDVHVTPEVIGG
jgi:hypothetical protein